MLHVQFNLNETALLMVVEKSVPCGWEFALLGSVNVLVVSIVVSMKLQKKHYFQINQHTNVKTYSCATHIVFCDWSAFLRSVQVSFMYTLILHKTCSGRLYSACTVNSRISFTLPSTESCLLAEYIWQGMLAFIISNICYYCTGFIFCLQLWEL